MTLLWHVIPQQHLPTAHPEPSRVITQCVKELLRSVQKWPTRGSTLFPRMTSRGRLFWAGQGIAWALLISREHLFFDFAWALFHDIAWALFLDRSGGGLWVGVSDSSTRQGGQQAVHLQRCLEGGPVPDRDERCVLINSITF